MNMKMNNKISCDNVKHVDIINNLNPDKNVTEEEFQNFMHRVTEVGEYYLSGQTFTSIYKFERGKRNVK